MFVPLKGLPYRRESEWKNRTMLSSISQCKMLLPPQKARDLGAADV